MTKVNGDDVYSYIANGFFICLFSCMLLMTIVICVTSLKRNRVQSRFAIAITCILIALILTQKVLQLSFLVASTNLSEETALYRVFQFLADILVNLTSRFTILFLAYVHVYMLADNAFACFETTTENDQLLGVDQSFILEFNFPYLVGTRIKVAFWLTCMTLFMLTWTVIPTFVLKLLVVIMHKVPPNGLPAAADGFQSFFNQMISINLAFILLFGTIFASKSIKHMISFESKMLQYQSRYSPELVTKNVMRKSVSAKRVYIALGYLAIFEFYNLFFEILTGRNVLLFSYIIVSLLLVAAFTNNRLDRPKHQKTYRDAASDWYHKERLGESAAEIPLANQPEQNYDTSTTAMMANQRHHNYYQQQPQQQQPTTTEVDLLHSLHQ